jgi:hypothetical protein
MAEANYSRESIDDFINRSMGSPAVAPASSSPVLTSAVVGTTNRVDLHNNNIIFIRSEIEKYRNNPTALKTLNDELAKEQNNLSGAQSSEMDKFISASMKKSTDTEGQKLAAEIDRLQPSRFVNVVASPKSEEDQLAEAQTGVAVNPMMARQGAKIRQRVQDTGYTTQVSSVGDLAKKILQPASALADIAIGAVPATIGQVAFNVARPFTTPENAQQIQKNISEPYQNLTGRLANIEHEPGYTGEAVTRIMGFVGENVGKGAQWISDKTGAPVQDVESMIQTLSLAVPGAVKAGTKVAKGAVEFGRDVATTRQQLADQFAQKKAPAAAPEVAAVEAEAPPMKGGGAAVSNLNPYPQFTGQDVGKGELFPVVKSSQIASNVPANEQALRAQIASEVTKSNQVRTGVITGNEDILRNEHTEAASPNPSVKGQLLKSQIANEQNGLRNFAEDRIKATGASENLVNETQRGERINDVFYGKQEAGEAPTTLQSYLDQAKKQVYDSARQIHGDKPTLSTNFNTLINDEQWQAGLSLNEKQGIAATAQKFMNLADTKGFKDINGVLQPAGSVSAKDAVRKALNKKWTHENANVIREINQAIDMDIAAVADPKLYKLGDRIHQAEKNIYDTKGIKKLFGEVDEKGIVRSKTALDKVTSTLNDLPKDEWKHIRSTLDDLSKGVVRNAPEGMPPVPDSLRQSAAAAVKEIDGALAREVFRAGAKDQGVWNQNRATNILNSRVGEKIHETFPPNEVVNFHKLNYAGHFMPGKHVYEGAALQTERVKNIFERNLGKIGATAGGAIGTAIAGPGIGTGIGGFVGGHLGVKGSAALEANALQKAATKLQDEMRRNAKIGTGTKLKNVGKKD